MVSTMPGCEVNTMGTPAMEVTLPEPPGVMAAPRLNTWLEPVLVSETETGVEATEATVLGTWCGWLVRGVLVMVMEL